MADRWAYGDVIVRREILGLAPVRQSEADVDWHMRPWAALPVHVVEDSADRLVTYIAAGAEFGFYPGPWPTPTGLHPWDGRRHWSGHGCLMVQRPGDHHAVFHFWHGPSREFRYWYINLQTDFVRTPVGYDTQDLELDVLVFPDGRWELKDAEVLPDRIREGRYSHSFVEWIESIGEELTVELDAGRRWWDDQWRTWQPPDDWQDTKLPHGWATSWSSYST